MEGFSAEYEVDVIVSDLLVVLSDQRRRIDLRHHLADDRQINTWRPIRLDLNTERTHTVSIIPEALRLGLDR